MYSETDKEEIVGIGITSLSRKRFIHIFWGDEIGKL